MAVVLAANGKPAGPRNPVQVETPLFVARDSLKHIGERRLICRVCEAMGKESVFYLSEMAAFQRHVKDCSARYEPELRSRSLRVKSPVLFDPEVSGDVEFRDWLRRNKTAVLEGRKKV